MTTYCNETSNDQIERLKGLVAFLQTFEVRVFPPLMYMLTTAGVIGSCMTLLTMKSKVYGSLQPFTNLTRINAVVCIALDVVNFVTTVIGGLLIGEATSCGMHTFNRLLHGTLNYLALVNDCMFLILTVERYFAICYPIRWYITSKVIKDRVLWASIAFALLLSLARFHNGIEFTCSFKRAHRNAYEAKFLIVRTIVNLGIPALFVAPLIYMNVQIFRAVLHQTAKLQALNRPSTTMQNSEKKNDGTTVPAVKKIGYLKVRERKDRKVTAGITVINLMLFLFSIFIYSSCALQSCYHLVYTWSAQECNELVYNLYRQELLLIHQMSIRLLRTLSGSAMFYAYFLLNQTFRNEFRNAAFRLYRSVVAAKSQSTVHPVICVSQCAILTDSAAGKAMDP